MALGTQEIVPNADFSALGLGRLQFTDEEIAVAEIASLSAWLDPATYWATGMVAAAAPIDRANMSRAWTKNGSPAAATGINGKPTWSTPGNAIHSFSNAGAILPTAADWTLSFVCKPAVASVLNFVLGSATSPNYFAVSRHSDNGVRVFANGAQVINYGAAAWTTVAKHIEVTHNHATKLMTLLVDGVSRGTATLGADQANLTLGVGYTGAGAASLALNGDMGEVLVFGADLSLGANAADQAALVTYLRNKYGLA